MGEDRIELTLACSSYSRLPFARRQGQGAAREGRERDLVSGFGGLV
jgi:hypothetical protein